MSRQQSKEYVAVSNYLKNTIDVRKIIREEVKSCIQEMFNGYQGQCVLIEMAAMALGGKLPYNTWSDRYGRDKAMAAITQSLTTTLRQKLLDKIPIKLTVEINNENPNIISVFTHPQSGPISE
jgi:hypothetical protein